MKNHTRTIYSKDIRAKRNTHLIKREEVNSLDPHELFEYIRELKDNNYLVSVQKDPNNMDIKLIDMIFGNNVSPVFFSGKKSSSIKVQSAKKFYKAPQYGNNYYMPVTFRATSDRKYSTRKVLIEDYKEDEVTVSFMNTTRSNINSVRALLIDIDIHNKEYPLGKEELDELAHRVYYFAEQANTAPTAIVNSGRGLQLIYIPKIPLYRNSKNIDKLLKLSHSTLAKIIDTEVLPNIKVEYNNTTYKLECDKAINPINQKMRCPGTFNFNSYTYAHTVILVEDNLYNFGDFLSNYLGDYEEYLELKAKKAAERRALNKVRRANNNHGNGAGNIIKSLLIRIEAIKKATMYCSKTYGTGFRNRSYYTWSWLALSIKSILKENSKTEEQIAQDLYSFDRNLVEPYFDNIKQAENLVRSTAKTISKSKTIKLKDKSIEAQCIALNWAHDDNIDVKPFFTPTVKELRKEKQVQRDIDNMKLLNNIKNNILDNVNIKAISNKHQVARNTIYDRLKKLAKDLNLKGFEKSVKGLYLALRKKLIQLLTENKASKNNSYYQYLSKLIDNIFSSDRLLYKKLCTFRL